MLGESPTTCTSALSGPACAARGREPCHPLAIDDVAHHAAGVVTLGDERRDLTLEVIEVAIGEQHPVRAAEAPGDRHGHPTGADDDGKLLGAHVRACVRVGHRTSLVATGA